MPFDGKGTFSRLYRWREDKINRIQISSDRMDDEHDNFADGLSQCLLRNGLSKMEGDLNVNNFKIHNVANGTSNLDAVNKSQLDSLQTTLQAYADAIIPKGTILPYGGSAAPTGFLLCNGAAVSRTTYADLFAVIGTTYGSGDGSTTFNLPNSENLVTSVNTSVPIKGTGKALGFTDGTGNYGSYYSGSGTDQFLLTTSSYDADVGTATASGGMSSNKVVGMTTDETKSGVVGTVTRSVLTCKHIIKY